MKPPIPIPMLSLVMLPALVTPSTPAEIILHGARLQGENRPECIVKTATTDKNTGAKTKVAVAATFDIGGSDHFVMTDVNIGALGLEADKDISINFGGISNFKEIGRASCRERV